MADPVGFALNIAIQAAISLIIAALRPKQDIEGPRLDDTSIASAAYGKTIPIGYGTDIVGGNIIWGQEIEEVAKEYDIGKGNPFSLGTRTEYKYFLTCAVGISQRQVDRLIGIYADGKLIYDAEAVDGKPSGNLHPFLDDVPESERVNDKGNERSPPIIKNLEFNFYDGALSQEQDPIIAADVGAAVCPAYRGLSYIVFNRMPLKDLGNRVPQFRFVVAWDEPDETELVFRAMGSDDPVRFDTAEYPWVYDKERDIVYSLKYGTNGIEGQSAGYYLEAADAQTGDQLAFNYDISQVISSLDIGSGDPVTVEKSPVDFMVGAVGDYLVIDSGSENLGFHTTIMFYDKETLEGAGATTSNIEIQAFVDPDGDGLPTIQSAWTIPGLGAVNFRGGMQTVSVPTLQGPRNYVIGGPALNSDGAGGTHLHSIGVLDANGLNPGGVGWHENMHENNAGNFLGIDEWRYGLVSGPTGASFFGFGFIGAVQGRTIETGTIEVFIMMGTDPNSGTQGIRVHLTEMNSGGSIQSTGISWLVTDYGAPGSGGANRPNACYVEDSNRLVFVKGDLWQAYGVNRSEISDNGGTPPIIWERTDLLGLGRTMDTHHLRPDGDRLMSRDSLTGTSEGIFRVVDVSTGDIVKTYTAPEFTLGDGLATNYIPSMYEPSQDRGLVMVELAASQVVFGLQYFEPGLNRPGEPLDRVVSDIVTRGKLATADIDVTGLSTETVRGYVIARDTTYRKALEPLQTAYNFIGVERDGKVVFEFKTGATDIVVPEDDLVRSSRENIFEEERKDEVTVPRMVFINYRSTNLKDERATQHARQITDTYLTIGAQGDVSTELPLVLSDQEGREIAERMLYESRLSLDNFKFTLPAQYLRLAPGDVLEVTAAGRVENIRALEVAVGFNLELEVEGSLVDGDVYSPNVTAAVPYGSPNFSSNNIDPQPAPSVIGFLLDIPPIRYDMVSTLSRTAGTYMGFAAGLPPVYSRRRFVGGALQVSYTDGSDFSSRAVAGQGVAYGLVSSTIPAMPDPDYNGVQNASITINVADGFDQFVSVTQAQMIGESQNVAILYSPFANILEVIRFRDVEEITSGSGQALLRLSNLMRGQRGTNTEALRWASETPGQVYLLLATEQTIRIFTEPLARQGDTVAYRTFPVGETDPTTLRTRELTYQLRGLKPFSPAHVRLTFDDPSGGEYEILWERRTRGEGAWRNSVGDVQLEEDTEAYEVDILDGSGGTVLRTMETTSPSVLYTADQIDTDFGSSGLPSPLYARVYQISGQVGRGYSYEAALTVEG